MTTAFKAMVVGLLSLLLLATIGAPASTAATTARAATQESSQQIMAASDVAAAMALPVQDTTITPAMVTKSSSASSTCKGTHIKGVTDYYVGAEASTQKGVTPNGIPWHLDTSACALQNKDTEMFSVLVAKRVISYKNGWRTYAKEVRPLVSTNGLMRYLVKVAVVGHGVSRTFWALTRTYLPEVWYWGDRQQVVVFDRHVVFARY